MSIEKLAAKVKATNRANAEAIKVSAHMREVFTPYVGRKVVNADGSLIKALRDKHKELAFGPFLRVVPQVSNYSIYYNVQVCERAGEHSNVYSEACPYVCDIRDGILLSVYKQWEGRTDYTADEVLAARAEVKAAQKALSEAQGKLGPFGEYDR